MDLPGWKEVRICRERVQGLWGTSVEGRGSGAQIRVYVV